MRKLTQQKYDEVEVRPELYREDISKEDLDLLNDHLKGGSVTKQISIIKSQLGE